MKIRNDHKVAGGKLVKIDGDSEMDKIINIEITGDFFMFPEDGIEVIEHELVGCELKKDDIVVRVEETLEKNEIKVQGFTPEDLADAIIGGIQTEETTP